MMVQKYGWLTEVSAFLEG